MDDEFWSDPARQMRAQMMLQQLYNIVQNQTAAEQSRAATEPRKRDKSVDAIEATEEHSPVIKPKKKDTGPPCDAQEIFTAMLAREPIDLANWRSKHMALSKEHPKQHQDCHRTVWRIVDTMEQRHDPLDEIIVLMRDVHTLSTHHPFNHNNSSHKLADLLISRSKPEDVIEAVGIQRESLQVGGAGTETGNMARLVETLDLQFRRTPDLGILKEQISLARQLLLLDPGRPRYIMKLVRLLIELYERTSDPDILFEAQALGKEIEERQNPKAECEVLSEMEAEFRTKGDIEDVKLWIAQHMSLVQASPQSHASCPERLLSLVEDMKSRSSSLEVLATICREALGLTHRGIGISNQLKALNTFRTLQAATTHHQDSDLELLLIKRIYSLVSSSEHQASVLLWLVRRTLPSKPKPAREGSTDWHRASFAFDAIAQLEADRVPGLQWVNPMLAKHNEGARPPETMEDYRDVYIREAMQYGDFEKMPDKSPQKAQSLTMHAAAILANNDPEQVDLVIDLLRSAVWNWGLPPNQPLPSRHPARQTVNFLGHAYYMRHWYFGQAEDIEMSVRTIKWCFAGAKSESDWMPHVGTLCAGLEARYRCLGSVKDIEDATALAHLFFTKVPKDDTIQMVALRSAGKTADCLFDAVGGIALLDHAASQVRKALRLSSINHPLMAALMGLLGSILRKRFTHLLMPNDLAVSEQLTRGAVALQEDTGGDAVHQDLGHNRALFGETMLTKFEQDPRAEYLEQALSAFELILQRGRDDDADRADAHYRYGNALRIRYRQGDIANAIIQLRKALLIQPATRHSRYPLWATGLSAALLVDFSTTQDPQSIVEALNLSESAASLVGDKNTARADVYAQLGNVLLAVYQSQGRGEDLEGCLLAFETAASSPSSPRPRCLKYTRTWEDIALKYEHSSILNALDMSLSHQTKIAGIGRTVKSRHEYLAKDPIPASRAAAYAIRQGKFERAIEYLENGRSLVWRQTLELRSSLEALHRASASLASRFAAVIEGLDSSANTQSVSTYSSTLWGVIDPDQILRHNRELADQYESLLSQIRKLEGFEDFLQAFRFSDTQGLSSEGPVIVVNLCDEGCDALVLFESSVHHVPLPASFDELSIARTNIVTAAARVMYDGGSEMDSVLPPVLRLLWTSIVEPIIEFFKSIGTTFRRAFWCIAGLSDLPIHAAGLYKPGSVNLPDMVVSSYTPTLSALIRARRAKAQALPGRPRVLAVAQANAGGFLPLPYATEEVAAMNQLEIVTTALEGGNASPNSVMVHLQTHNWVHLCCHGTTNAQLPLLSAFHLNNGSLAIESLMRTELPAADFAFLSACHSAEGSVVQNENMSLASAMQVAGFRSVIATMYAIGDEDGPVIARTFYQYLFSDQSNVIDSSKAAFGLNKAIRVLRKAKVSMHRWVPFIHVGV